MVGGRRSEVGGRSPFGGRRSEVGGRSGSTRLAHVTDLHVDGSTKRRVLAERALERAHQLGGTHLVLTGDVTARGRPEELDELGRILDGSPWSARARPATVEVVFGNHDGVGAEEAARGTALDIYCGPFGYPRSRDLGDCLVFSASSVYPRRSPMFAAIGRIEQEDLDHLDRECAADPARCVVLAVHHGPQGHPLELLEGLVGKRRLLAAMDRHPNLHVVCGHDHRTFSRGRVHVAGSVAHHPDPVRTYDVVGPDLVPAYRSAHEGSWLWGILE